MKMNLSPIQMEWFYHVDGYKTKLNWFLLEVALEYYDFIVDCEELAGYHEQYDEKQIAQFCAYHARRLKKSLLNCLRRKVKSVIFYQEYIDDFYPHHDDGLNALLNQVAMEAYDHLVSGCEDCPQQCVQDYMAISPLFETYKDEEEEE